jgi:hypothetical protein
MNPPSIDLDLLLKLRLVVARFGEMDVAKWWNTRGQLGPLGAATLRRGFPRTHRFAQARSVLSVAAHRCSEVFDPPHSVTLWRLSESIEEDFDARWEHWLDHAADWETFFASLERIESDDLVAVLGARDLVGDGDVAVFARLRRSAEGRAVPLPGTFVGADQDIKLLAMGFGRSESTKLAIPYMRRDEA